MCERSAKRVSTASPGPPATTAHKARLEWRERSARVYWQLTVTGLSFFVE
jgi:hypothetical protein